MDNELAHILAEDEKAAKFTGEKRHKYVEASVAFQIELNNRGIHDENHRKFLTKGLASRIDFIDFSHGSAKRFNAKSAVDSLYSSAMKDFIGGEAKAENPSDMLPADFDTWHPSRKINYARAHGLMGT